MKNFVAAAIAACVGLTAMALSGCKSSRSAANAKPLRVLLITGGCCHEYSKQKDVLKEGLEQRANFQVTQIHTDDKSTKPPLNMPGGNWTGITINVKGNLGDPTMAIDVTVANAGA